MSESDLAPDQSEKKSGIDFEDLYFVLKRKHQNIMDKVTPLLGIRWGVLVTFLVLFFIRMYMK
jgi:hypothetical protein